MSTLQLKHVNKIYDNNVQAVFDFNLDVADKEFIVFVGPSGCGKSTTLRMIAGLEEISSGELYIDGDLMNDVLPKDRNIAMVFQSYALYPHMTVYDNMAFALKMRKMDKAEIDKRVKDAAEILELTPYLQRKPKALSGGQRQRVALGRAIVRNAKVFLMDEPLSNLDAKLRVQMRAEIIRLHQRLGATIVYVTHDQTEAMTMADRIVVMKAGHVQQIGHSKEIYDHPANIFVAGFMGTPAMNLLRGTCLENSQFKIGERVLDIPADRYAALKDGGYVGKEVILGIRPEDLHNEKTSDDKKYEVDLVLDVVEMLGADTILHGSVEGHEVQAKIPASDSYKSGDVVPLGMVIEKIHFFDPETEKIIGD